MRKRIMLLSILGAVGTSAVATPPMQPAASVAPIPDAAMEHPLERRFFAIASHDGEATIVAEVLSGRYSLDADLSSLCRDFERAEQMWSPACLVIERYDAIREGDPERYASLFRPDSERREELRQGETDQFWRSQEQVAAVKAVRPTTLKAWGEYWVVDIVSVSQEDQITELPVTNRFIADAQADRLWLTDDLSTFNYPIHHVSRGFDEEDDVLATVPPSMTALRLETIEDPEDDRKVRAELLGPDANVGPRDLILYIKEDRFPLDAPPLLEMDRAGLDEAGKSLQTAIDIVRRWRAGEQIPIEQLVELWHPSNQDGMRQRHERGAGILGMRDSAENLSRLRVISRTRTDNGIVWFAWYPDPTASMGASSVAILQLKDDAGNYRLVYSSFQVPIPEYSTDNRAMLLLGGDHTTTFAAVPRSITARHLAELQAQSEPIDR